MQRIKPSRLEVGAVECNEWYDTKPLNVEAPVQEICGMWSTSPLSLLPGSLCPRLVKLFNHLLYKKPLTMCKQMINVEEHD